MDLLALQYEGEITFHVVISRSSAPCCAGFIQERGGGGWGRGGHILTQTLILPLSHIHLEDQLYICLAVTCTLYSKEINWHLIVRYSCSKYLLYDMNHRHKKQYSG